MSLNVSFPDTSMQVYFGVNDVCNYNEVCVANPRNPWATSFVFNNVSNAPVTFHSITAQSAYQSHAVPFLEFQFQGSAVYLYTVTTPSSTGAFNITVDGGVTWSPNHPNVTTDQPTPDHLAWYRTGLDPSVTTILTLRFWGDPSQQAYDTPSASLAELNVQKFDVTQISPTTIAPSTPISSSLLSPSTQTNASSVASFASQNREAMIIGLSVGIPLALIPVVLCALLLIMLQRRRERKKQRQRRSSIYTTYVPKPGRPRKSQNISILDLKDASPNLDGPVRNRRVTSSYPAYGNGSGTEPFVAMMSGDGPLLVPRQAATSEIGKVEPFVMNLPVQPSVMRGTQTPEPIVETLAVPRQSLPLRRGTRRRISTSSGIGGSSGEQGGSSDESSISEDVTEAPLRIWYVTTERPSIRRSSLSFGRTSMSTPIFSSSGRTRLPSSGGDYRFSGSQSQISRTLPPIRTPPSCSPPPTPPDEYLDQVRESLQAINPMRIAKEREARSCRRLSVYNPTPPPETTSSANEVPERSYADRSQTTEQDQQSNNATDQDTTFRSFNFGPTSDPGWHSPIPSTPEPMPIPRLWTHSDTRSDRRVRTNQASAVLTTKRSVSGTNSQMLLSNFPSPTDIPMADDSSKTSHSHYTSRPFPQRRQPSGQSADDSRSSANGGSSPPSAKSQLRLVARARTLSALSPGDAEKMGLNDSSFHPRPPPYYPDISFE